MSSIIDLLAKNIFHKAVVSYKAQIASGTFHIRITADHLRDHNYIAGEHLRLFVGLDKPTAINEKLRTYSIWGFDSKTGTADIAACTHSSGVGARWIREVKVGDTIYFMGPRAKLVIDHDADSYLMIGDDSALSHLYAINRAIPAHKKVTGWAYSADKTDLFADIDGKKPFEMLALPQNPVSQIIDKLSLTYKETPKHTIAYLAGDARLCKEISRFLSSELDWDGSRLKVRGFWMPGKTGMD